MKASTFYESILPIYFISKILGQIPYGVIRGNHKVLLSFNAFGIAYSLLCYCLYFVALYFFIIDNLRFNYYESYPRIGLVGHIMHVIIGFVNSLIGIILAFMKKKKLSQFLTEMYKIDDELHDLCETIRIDYKKSFMFQLKCLVTSILLFCLVGIFDYYVFQGLYGTMSILVVISYIMPYMMAACSSGQFILGVRLIYERFVLINNFLNNIADTNEPTNIAVKMHLALFEDDKMGNSKSFENTQPFSISRNLVQRKHINSNNMEMNRGFSVNSNNTDNKSEIDSVSSNAREKFNDFVTSTNRKTIEQRRVDDENSSSSSSTQSFFQFFKSNISKTKKKINEQTELNYPLNLHLRMNEIFSMHDKLCDIAECFNDLYSIEMVVNITGSFIMILFGIFFETKVIFWSQGFNMELFAVATSYILWGILVSTIIYVSLRVCSNTREESCESALIIHKILQNKPAFMLNDEVYYSKMKSFTLQILNRKKIFHFNGLGLFKLDYTFIFSAVSAATSYLIVLLQFDMTADFQKFVTNTNTTFA